MIEKHTSNNKTARILALAALAGWGISLLLPGFWTGHHSADKWGGANILLTGTLFGWMVIGGWAVYANLFFLYAVGKAYQGRPAPIAAALILPIAGTILFFEGPIHPGLGSTMPIQSWGWGTVLWVLSLLTGVVASGYAALHVGSPRGKGILVVLVVMLVLASAIVGGVRYYQWGRANTQDRALLLPPLAAFTVSEICEAPFVDVTGPLVPAGERVTVEIDESLRTIKGLPDLGPLPSLGEITRKEGLDYVTYKNIPGMPTDFEMLVQVQSVSTRFVLRVERTNSGALLELRDLHANKVLYQQPFAIRWTAQGHPRYCPSFHSGRSSTTQGVRQVLEKLVAHRPPVAQRYDFVPETAIESCLAAPVIFPNGDNSEEWIKWEGRRLNLVRENRLARSPGFCSKSYAGLVNIDMIDVGDVPHILSGEVLLFERTNLRPLARFRSDSVSGAFNQALEKNPHARSYRAHENLVTGFTVNSSESLTIHTKNGDMSVQLIHRGL